MPEILIQRYNDNLTDICDSSLPPVFGSHYKAAGLITSEEKRLIRRNKTVYYNNWPVTHITCSEGTMYSEKRGRLPAVRLQTNHNKTDDNCFPRG